MNYNCDLGLPVVCLLDSCIAETVSLITVVTVPFLLHIWLRIIKAICDAVVISSSDV
jgi:hypothetical protein